MNEPQIRSEKHNGCISPGALLRAMVALVLPVGLAWGQGAPPENLNATSVDISAYDSRIDQFSGDHTTRFPFEVPAFRGMEPGLGLNYRSSGGNGVVGVGWSLQGDSRIERVSPGRGVPNWTSSDIYLLDGIELVPCKAGSVSPSCTSGGSHSTKIGSSKSTSIRVTIWLGLRTTRASHSTPMASSLRSPRSIARPRAQRRKPLLR